MSRSTPARSRDFAKAAGRLAKTDALDGRVVGRVLAQFVEAVRPALRPLRDADTQNLNELTTRRNWLMAMLVAEKTVLGGAPEQFTPGVNYGIEAHISWPEKELKDLDEGLRETLLRSPVWRKKDGLLRPVPGVGRQVSVSLLAYLPELGTRDRRRIAALVGAAPINRDRGIVGGRRAAWGGRSRVRAALYLGTLVATRCNPAMRVFQAGTICRRQGRESCTRRRYAQAADHTQQHGEGRSELGPSNDCTLTPKTVASVDLMSMRHRAITFHVSDLRAVLTLRYSVSALI